MSQSDPTRVAPRFPSQFEDVVLRLEVGAGAFPIATALKVYSTGAAVLESRGGSNAAHEADAGEFSSETMDEVLQLIQEGNLLEYDERRVDAEQRRLAGGVDLLGADADTFLVEFRLEYPGVSSSKAIVHKTILISAPEARAKRYPSIPEYRALAELSLMFRRGAPGAREAGMSAKLPALLALGCLAAVPAGAGVFLGSSLVSQDAFSITHPVGYTGTARHSAGEGVCRARWGSAALLD